MATLWDNRAANVSAFQWVGGFFTKLFFFGAFFRYWQVARKLIVDERNHDKVVSKQNQVLARLEAVGEKLEGVSTGGDGYAHVWDVQTNANGGINALFVQIVGDYSLHDISIQITTRQTIARRVDNYRNTGNISSLLASDFTHHLTIIHPRTMQVVSCNVPLSPGEDTYIRLNWTARNGSWSEKLYLAWVENRWRAASKVWHSKTGEGDPSEHAGPNYPRDTLEKPMFPEYENEKPSRSA